ncbi:MAG: hypothetical protein ACFN9G_07005 [Cardiobacterium sp.]
MSKVKIIALGGVRENGKNLYIAEVDESIFVLDAVATRFSTPPPRHSPASQERGIFQIANTLKPHPLLRRLTESTKKWRNYWPATAG